MTNRWRDMANSEYLVFPGGVYLVDFAGRLIRMLFTARGRRDRQRGTWVERRKRNEDQKLVIVSTDKSFHIVTEAGLTGGFHAEGLRLPEVWACFPRRPV